MHGILFELASRGPAHSGQVAVAAAGLERGVTVGRSGGGKPQVRRDQNMPSLDLLQTDEGQKPWRPLAQLGLGRDGTST